MTHDASPGPQLQISAEQHERAGGPLAVLNWICVLSFLLACS